MNIATIDYEQHDPNNPDMDEYTVCVQFMSKDFLALVRTYDESPVNHAFNLIPGLGAEEFARPFVPGSEEHALDLCIWLAQMIKRRIIGRPAAKPGE